VTLLGSPGLLGSSCFASPRKSGEPLGLGLGACGIASLGKVAWAVLETTGKMSFIEKAA